MTLPVEPTSQPSQPSRRHLIAVGAAAAISAVAGYVIMVITARVLDVAQNAQFLVFWSLLFFCFGLLGGIQNEATRAVRSVQGTRGAGVRPLPVALVMGALLAIVVVVTQRLWATQWFPTTSTAVVVAVSVSVVLFAGHSALAGTLAGRGLWHTFAVLVSAESLLRLALVSTAVLVGWRAGGLELGAAFAAGAWVLLCLVAPGARSEEVSEPVGSGHACHSSHSSPTCRIPGLAPHHKLHD